MKRTFQESAPDLAALASALADPSRAFVCICLMDGRAWTATELGRHCGVGKSTMSAHLNALVGAGLLTEVRQGRHRYVRLASGEVADLVEQLGLLARSEVSSAPSLRVHMRDQALREARTCYRHLAGRLGLTIADALTALSWVDQEARPTVAGVAGLREVWGLPVPEASATGGALSRWCLDWTERRPHIAGRLGDGICNHFLERGWVVRRSDGRALHLTDDGRSALARLGDRVPVAQERDSLAAPLVSREDGR